MNDVISLVNGWAAAWGEAIVRASWLGGLVLLAVLAFSRLVPQLPTFARCWLWRLAYIKLLLLLLWIAPVELPLLPTADALPAIKRVARQSMSNEKSTPTGTAAYWVDLSASPAPTNEAPSGTAISVATWMMATWACGVLAYGGLVWSSWRKMSTLRKSCSPICDVAFDTLNAKLCAQLGRKTPPRLLTATSKISPQLVGIVKPCIIVPASLLAHCPQSDAKMILAHELAHWKRRDLLWNWLSALGHALFFFHPMVWFAQREWRLAQEIACDEIALRITRARTTDYGRLLLDVLRLCSPAARPSYLAVGASTSFNNLHDRITAMKSSRPASALRNRSAAMLVCTAAIVGLIPWQITTRATGETRAQANDASTLAPDNAAPAKEAKTEKVESAASDSDESQRALELPGQMFVQATLRPNDGEEVNSIIRLDPNSGKWESFGQRGHNLRVSPDGTLLAFDGGDKTWICDAKTGGNAHAVADVGGRPIWSPDGRQLIVSDGELIREEDSKENPEKPVWRVETWKFNRDSSGKELLPVPSSDFVEDWSPDGKWLVSSSDRHAPFGRGYQLYLISADGSMQRRLTHGKGLNVHVRFSPDSKSIVFLHQERGRNSIRKVDIEDGKETEIYADVGPKRVQMANWSPDGKHLVVTRQNWKVGPDGKMHLSADDMAAVDHRLDIITLNGKKLKTIRPENAEVEWMGHPDWK